MAKCSNCSAIVKPVVAVDIDGTLANYHAHFADFAFQYLGDYEVRERIHRYFNGSTEMHEVMGISLELYREVKLAYRQGGGKRSIYMFEGSRFFVNALQEAGAEVWLTTTRPYLRLDSTDPDTREWCRRNEIPYDHLLYDEDKYLKLPQIVDPERIVAIVDDLLPVLLTAVEAGIPKERLFLRATRYNRAFTMGADRMGVRVVTDFSISSISRIVRDIETWKDNHA